MICKYRCRWRVSHTLFVFSTGVLCACASSHLRKARTTHNIREIDCCVLSATHLSAVRNPLRLGIKSITRGSYYAWLSASFSDSFIRSFVTVHNIILLIRRVASRCRGSVRSLITVHTMYTRCVVRTHGTGCCHGRTAVASRDYRRVIYRAFCIRGCINVHELFTGAAVIHAGSSSTIFTGHNTPRRCLPGSRNVTHIIIFLGYNIIILCCSDLF